MVKRDGVNVWAAAANTSRATVDAFRRPAGQVLLLEITSVTTSDFPYIDDQSHQHSHQASRSSS